MQKLTCDCITLCDGKCKIYKLTILLIDDIMITYYLITFLSLRYCIRPVIQSIIYNSKCNSYYAFYYEIHFSYFRGDRRTQRKAAVRPETGAAQIGHSRTAAVKFSDI